jgi:[ribosomal protein S18]-alanine N-acetyltransferase
VTRQLEVRDLRPDDLDRLAALEHEAFGRDAWSAAVVRAELVAPGRAAMVAAEGGGLLGYAVTWLHDDVADVQRVVVTPGARRRGVATRLLRELFGRAVAGGARRVLLEVSTDNRAAHGCYRRLGFEELDRRRGYYRDGSDALVLQLALPPSTSPSTPSISPSAPEEGRP